MDRILYVPRSSLHKSENRLAGVVLFVTNSRLKNPSPMRKILAPESSASFKGRPSSSFTAWNVSRWRTKHVVCVCTWTLALSFSVCVQGKVCSASSRPAMLTRVRLAMLWLKPWKLMQANVVKYGAEHKILHRQALYSITRI